MRHQLINSTRLVSLALSRVILLNSLRWTTQLWTGMESNYRSFSHGRDNKIRRPASYVRRLQTTSLLELKCKQEASAIYHIALCSAQIAKIQALTRTPGRFELRIGG